MRSKYGMIAIILALLLCAMCTLSGCNSQKKQLEDALNRSLDNFIDALSDSNLSGMEVYVYSNEGLICTYGPYGVDNLIHDVENGFWGQKFYISNTELINNKEILNEIGGWKFVPILDSNCREDIRICYVFQTNNNSKILEIAIGGYSQVEDCPVMFVNGFPVELDMTYGRLVKNLPQGVVCQ